MDRPKNKTQDDDSLFINILQMDCQSLTKYLKELMLENPVMEMVLPPDQAHKSGRQEMAKIKLKWLEEQIQTAKNNCGTFDEPQFTPEDEDSQPPDSIEAILLEQAEECDPVLRSCVKLLINCLDSDGYLAADYETQCVNAGMRKDEIEAALKCLQRFEPRGVGARSLGECLSLQLVPGQELERTMLQKYYDAVVNGDDEAVAASESITVQAVGEARARLMQLNPKPGFTAADPAQMRDVPADIVVTTFKTQYYAMLCSFEYPAIHLNGHYLNMIDESDDPEVTKYLQQKTDQLVDVRRAIDRRGELLVKFAMEIVRRQQRFFHAGPRHLGVLRVRDVAQALGIDERTAVLALRGKLLRCAQGVYPLSYFFIGE